MRWLKEGRKLITWGAQAFERVAAYAEGTIVADANVYGGEGGSCRTGRQGSSAYLPRGSRKCLSAEVCYNAPLLPPVNAGDQIAESRVFCDDNLVQVALLYAADSGSDSSITRIAADALKQLALGWL
ncbi:MAG: hypothetical protein MO846_00785 [Candidatus Devosia symbiotica]|nr:hypothetical protein [Candidatus Devosia symbiotica]